MHDRLITSLLACSLLVGCNESFTADDAGARTVDASVSVPIVDAGTTLDDDAGPVEVEDAGPVDSCGDERRGRLVYYGTELPTVMPLTPGQVLAVVDFGSCSGAFVADQWVLTAKHCGVGVGTRLCVGPNPRDADVCFTAARVENNPSVDMTLIRVDAPASSRIPELEPIPIITEVVDDSWLGRMAEAAGYGTQEDGSSGEREFTAEPIVRLDPVYATIDGMGERGVCFGDSGGPLMVLASDSTVRVLGALSYGDPSCTGQDSYTRTDRQLSWIEATMGPIVVDGAPCGRVGPEGDCMGTNTAIWCDPATDRLASETCAAGTACGWDVEDSGYRCVADDPCGGVSAAGRCAGETAEWCDSGTLRSRTCGACGERCRFVSEVGGFYCQPDPCIGIPPEGMCEGNVLVVCDPDQGIQRQDCSARGRVCEFSRRRGAYRCVRR